MDPTLVPISRFLSLVLRHNPGVIGLELDSAGWADVNELVQRASAHGRPLSVDLVRDAVEQNDKRRFSFSADGTRVRAVQGHSIPVDLGLERAAPPATLYHGTAQRFLDAIRQEGLQPRARQHVHLSDNAATAVQVGARHGRPVALQVDSLGMAAEGFAFFQAENGVWLTAAVPPRFLAVSESPERRPERPGDE